MLIKVGVRVSDIRAKKVGLKGLGLVPKRFRVTVGVSVTLR